MAIPVPSPAPLARTIEPPSFETDLGKALLARCDAPFQPGVWLGKPNDIDLETQNQRQRTWRMQLAKMSLTPIEFLLPRITVRYDARLPESMQRAENAAVAKPDELKRLSEHIWGYYFYLGGGISTKNGEPGEADGRGQSLMRFEAINGTVARMFGDQLSSQSVVDMACRGAGEVLGVDIRDDNVAKANDLARYLDVPNISFATADVYDIKKLFSRQFDIVYNLGLLYHVTDPYELMRLTYDICGKVAVVDTAASREPYSGFALTPTHTVRMPEHARGAKAIELMPTYRAVIDLMTAVGFRDLVEIAVDLGPDFPGGNTRNTLERYLRRRIIGFK